MKTATFYIHIYQPANCWSWTVSHSPCPKRSHGEQKIATGLTEAAAVRLAADLNEPAHEIVKASKRSAYSNFHGDV